MKAGVIRLPSLGMAMTEGIVTRWHIGVGDLVREGQVVLDIESEKTVSEIEAPSAGKCCALLVAEGTTVPVDTPLAILCEQEATAEQVQALIEEVTGRRAGPAETPATTAAGADRAGLPAASPGVAPKASPAAKKLARELGIELAEVAGHGPGGSIERSDVEAFAGARHGQGAAPVAAPVSPPADRLAPVEALAWPRTDPGALGPVGYRELSRVQQVTGDLLHRNWVRIPHVTSHHEADVTAVERCRQRINRSRRDGERLTYLPFLAKAAAVALREHPPFNASLVDGPVRRLALKRDIALSVAVDTPQGLLVPVLREVERKSVGELADELRELTQRARAGRLARAETEGGTFSISSLGAHAGRFFTPIINAPEVAILGVSRAYWSQRSEDGEAWTAALLLPLSLSWDHRAVDGAAAARFLGAFGRALREVAHAAGD